MKRNGEERKWKIEKKKKQRKSTYTQRNKENKSV